MWTRTPQGVFESSVLSEFPWLRHGFGSRQSVDWPGEYTGIKQIHSNIVQAVSSFSEPPHEGDALITATPGLRIGVRTADCVPILLVDSKQRIVAAVHAGWRGTVARIVQRTVDRLLSSFGSEPTNLYAAVGPCIASCCFEVGPEVAAEFAEWLPNLSSPGHVDLVHVNISQIIQSGVPAAQIDKSELCTACDAVQFHSFRRDKERAGRMVAAAEILAG